MTKPQWLKLMKQWSAQVRATNLVERLDEGDRDLQHLGYPPAKSRDISQLEKRLGVKLPPSYRSFLEATNGFRLLDPFIRRLRPAAEVDWFKVENEGWAKTWNEPTPYDDPERQETPDEEYFDYKYASEHDLRTKHLFTMLQISDADDGVMLLNPMVVTPDGEWEAWFFANWIPGATRHPSFAHLMVETYRGMRKLKKLPNKPKLPTIKIPGPKVPRHSVVEEPGLPPARLPKRNKGESQLTYIARTMDLNVSETQPAPPDLTSLLHELRNTDAKPHAKTLRTLEGKLVGRGHSDRYSDLVPLASKLAATHPDPEVRLTCVHLLTEIAPDEPAPEWLMAALQDPHPWVQNAGMRAIYYFKSPVMVEPVMRILTRAEHPIVACTAATMLGELADPRAVPTLVAQLEGREPQFEGTPSHLHDALAKQYFLRIALSIAKLQSTALPRLMLLLAHTDPKRRAAAIVALRVIGDNAARQAVMELKEDPDPAVRSQAALCDRVWGLK